MWSPATHGLTFLAPGFGARVQTMKLTRPVVMLKLTRFSKGPRPFSRILQALNHSLFEPQDESMSFDLNLEQLFSSDDFGDLDLFNIPTQQLVF